MSKLGYLPDQHHLVFKCGLVLKCHIQDTNGAKAEAWCLLIYADAASSLVNTPGLKTWCCKTIRAIPVRPYGQQIEHHLLEAVAVSPHRGWHARIEHAYDLNALVVAA